MKTKKIVINKCYGGFGLSNLAYEKLIAYGVPVRKYIKEKINSKTGLYEREPKNEGKVIFDKELTPKGEDGFDDLYWKFKGKNKMIERYWDCWTSENREDLLLIKVVEELGNKASADLANLEIVEIPDDVKYEIDDYDGIESVHEIHRSW